MSLTSRIRVARTVGNAGHLRHHGFRPFQLTRAAAPMIIIFGRENGFHRTACGPLYLIDTGQNSGGHHQQAAPRQPRLLLRDDNCSRGGAACGRKLGPDGPLLGVMVRGWPNMRPRIVIDTSGFRPKAFAPRTRRPRFGSERSPTFSRAARPCSRRRRVRAVEFDGCLLGVRARFTPHFTRT